MRYTSAVDGSRLKCAPRIKLVAVSLEELPDWMDCFYGVLEVLKVLYNLVDGFLFYEKCR